MAPAKLRSDGFLDLKPLVGEHCRFPRLQYTTAVLSIDGLNSEELKVDSVPVILYNEQGHILTYLPTVGVIARGFKLDHLVQAIESRLSDGVEVDGSVYARVHRGG